MGALTKVLVGFVRETIQLFIEDIYVQILCRFARLHPSSISLMCGIITVKRQGI